MRHRVTLIELLDRSFSWTWTSNTIAEFTLDNSDSRWDGHVFDVRFGYDVPEKWWVTFGSVEQPPSKKFDILSFNDQTLTMRILATVVAVIREFFERNPNVHTLEFMASGRGRVAAYQRILKRMLPTGWTLETQQHGLNVDFTIRRP